MKRIQLREGIEDTRHRGNNQNPGLRECVYLSLELSPSGFYFLCAGRRAMPGKKYIRVISMSCHNRNPPSQIPVVLFGQGLFLM